MQQHTFDFCMFDDFRSKLNKLAETLNTDSKSLLVQIYISDISKEETLRLSQWTQTRLSNSHVVVCSSHHQIHQGKIQEGHSVACITKFETSEIASHFYNIVPGSESESGDLFGQDIVNNNKDIQCVMYFVAPGSIESDRFVRSLGQHLKPFTVMGMGVNKGEFDFVSCNGEISVTGAVAIVLKGKSLRIRLNTILGWKPIGRSLKITSAENNRIYTIEQQPAVETYQHYTGANKASIREDIHIFPLIFERDGYQVARVADRVNDDGSLSFLADIHESESFRLGYGDIYTMEREVCHAANMLSEFRPEAIYLFPCISRKTFLEEDMGHELKPFEDLAPSVGFFSQLEVSSDFGCSNILNAAYVTLGLKEISKQSNAAPRQNWDIKLSSNAQRTAKLMHFMSKVTEDLEHTNIELERSSRVDFLTGALNRKAFNHLFIEQLNRLIKHEKIASLIMMDIDHFKQVNDNYGHLVGDDILASVSSIVRSQIREADLFARYGGEEFILFLANVDLDKSKELAERIRHAVEGITLEESSDSRPAVTCSFGIAQLCSSDNEVTLTQRADNALYKAKNSGRNRVEHDLDSTAPNN